jgi:hypothetical protein
MPFENHGSRSFTWVSVDRNAPAASGVYGLSNARQWIYVGVSANIQAELLNHLQFPDAFFKEYAPSGFTYELCPAERRVERQNQLVFELEPVGNRTAGQLSNWPLPAR